MILRIHHVAVSVGEGLDAGERIWGPAGIGLDAVGREVVPSQRTEIAMFPAGESRIELLSPTDGESPVRVSLDKRGPGLHHICFEVDDIEGEMATMRGRGLRFTTDAPTPGAHGSRVAFLHPKCTGGVLIELNEFPKATS